MSRVHGAGRPRITALPAIGCVVLVLLCGGTCVGYPILKIRWARATVDGFCARVVVGSPIAGLAQRAQDEGLRVMVSPERPREAPPKPAAIVAWEGFVFARRFCEVEHANGMVTGKRTFSLD